MIATCACECRKNATLFETGFQASSIFVAPQVLPNFFQWIHCFLILFQNPAQSNAPALRAASEDRNHDLGSMRPTCCQPHYRSFIVDPCSTSFSSRRVLHACFTTNVHSRRERMQTHPHNEVRESIHTTPHHVTNDTQNSASRTSDQTRHDKVRKHIHSQYTAEADRKTERRTEYVAARQEQARPK